MLAAIDKVIEHTLHLSHDVAENDLEFLINAFDKEHNVVFWNKKAEQFFGVSKEYALGKKLEEVIPYAKSTSRLHYIDRALFGKPIHIVKEKYEKKPAHYEQWILPVKKNGEVVAALNIVKDLL